MSTDAAQCVLRLPASHCPSLDCASVPHRSDVRPAPRSFLRPLDCTVVTDPTQQGAAPFLAPPSLRWSEGGSRRTGSAEAPPPLLPPPLSAAFAAWVATGAVAEEAAAAGSGVEAARHEAAQARSVARVGTLRAGPGGKVQYPPPLLPLRPRGLGPSPWARSALRRNRPARSPGQPAVRFPRRAALRGSEPVAGPRLPEEEAEALRFRVNQRSLGAPRALGAGLPASTSVILIEPRWVWEPGIGQAYG